MMISIHRKANMKHYFLLVAGGGDGSEAKKKLDQPLENKQGKCRGACIMNQVLKVENLTMKAKIQHPEL